MICFDVNLNGQRLCRAGVGESGTITTFVSWTGGAPLSPVPRGRTTAGLSRLSVGGAFGSLERQEYPQWVERQIRPGDTVSITVVKANSADRYRRKGQVTAESTAKLERRYYLQLKRRFEPSAKARSRPRKRRK